jgi:hypothetical protein
MGLRELDSEYESISRGPIEDRIEYCENLIHSVRSRLEEAGPEYIRLIMLEMIESAQNEVVRLREEYKSLRGQTMREQ